MAASTGSKVLSLYKQLLREGQRFSDYNFRNYARRRVSDAFRENKDVSDTSKISALILKAQENLEMLKRQTTICQLYGSGKLVIESQGGK